MAAPVAVVFLGLILPVLTESGLPGRMGNLSVRE